MASIEHKKIERKLNRTVAIYNMIPNLLWTVMFLTPIAVFCYRFIDPRTTYILSGVSLVTLFFPNSFFDKIQLSRKADWYTKAGVKFINKFAQHGTFVNKLLEKKYPGFKVIYKAKASIRKQYAQTYFYEKFHFSLFLFCTMVTVYAGFRGKIDWVITLIICNLLYNVYPNLLQQYIRVKLRSRL